MFEKNIKGEKNIDNGWGFTVSNNKIKTSKISFSVILKTSSILIFLVSHHFRYKLKGWIWYFVMLPNLNGAYCQRCSQIYSKARIERFSEGCLDSVQQREVAIGWNTVEAQHSLTVIEVHTHFARLGWRDQTFVETIVPKSPTRRRADDFPRQLVVAKAAVFPHPFPLYAFIRHSHLDDAAVPLHLPVVVSLKAVLAHRLVKMSESVRVIRMSLARYSPW